MPDQNIDISELFSEPVTSDKQTEAVKPNVATKETRINPEHSSPLNDVSTLDMSELFEKSAPKKDGSTPYDAAGEPKMFGIGNPLSTTNLLLSTQMDVPTILYKAKSAWGYDDAAYDSDAGVTVKKNGKWQRTGIYADDRNNPIFSGGHFKQGIGSVSGGEISGVGELLKMAPQIAGGMVAEAGIAAPIVGAAIGAAAGGGLLAAAGATALAGGAMLGAAAVGNAVSGYLSRSLKEDIGFIQAGKNNSEELARDIEEGLTGQAVGTVINKGAMAAAAAVKMPLSLAQKAAASNINKDVLETIVEKAKKIPDSAKMSNKELVETLSSSAKTDHDQMIKDLDVLDKHEDDLRIKQEYGFVKRQQQLEDAVRSAKEDLSVKEAELEAKKASSISEIKDKYKEKTESLISDKKFLAGEQDAAVLAQENKELKAIQRRAGDKYVQKVEEGFSEYGDIEIDISKKRTLEAIKNVNEKDVIDIAMLEDGHRTIDPTQDFEYINADGTAVKEISLAGALQELKNDLGISGESSSMARMLAEKKITVKAGTEKLVKVLDVFMTKTPEEIDLIRKYQRNKAIYNKISEAAARFGVEMPKPPERPNFDFDETLEYKPLTIRDAWDLRKAVGEIIESEKMTEGSNAKTYSSEKMTPLGAKLFKFQSKIKNIVYDEVPPLREAGHVYHQTVKTIDDYRNNIFSKEFSQLKTAISSENSFYVNKYTNGLKAIAENPENIVRVDTVKKHMEEMVALNKKYSMLEMQEIKLTQDKLDLEKRSSRSSLTEDIVKRERDLKYYNDMAKEQTDLLVKKKLEKEKLLAEKIKKEYDIYEAMITVSEGVKNRNSAALVQSAAYSAVMTASGATSMMPAIAAKQLTGIMLRSPMLMRYGVASVVKRELIEGIISDVESAKLLSLEKNISNLWPYGLDHLGMTKMAGLLRTKIAMQQIEDGSYTSGSYIPKKMATKNNNSTYERVLPESDYERLSSIKKQYSQSGRPNAFKDDIESVKLSLHAEALKSRVTTAAMSMWGASIRAIAGSELTDDAIELFQHLNEKVFDGYFAHKKEKERAKNK